ncbi:MAG: hypothetical protein KME46_00815 [Brasilonema angustatum HA4187-MV1]|nr:hypothetical protein [Brasilonema angustatum HA4187-MV1]
MISNTQLIENFSARIHNRWIYSTDRNVMAFQVILKVSRSQLRSEIGSTLGVCLPSPNGRAPVAWLSGNLSLVLVSP